MTRFNSRARLWQVALLTTVFTALVLAPGCRKPRKRIFTKAQERQIQNAVLDEAPTPQIPIGADLDGKVRLIGVDLDRAAVRPGGRFEITWYWEALAEAPGDWQIFVHFEGPGMRTTHDHHPVGELYPISKWMPGQIIKDVQTIQVKGDFPEGQAKVLAGIFQPGTRMVITNRDAVKVPTLADNRIEASKISVSKTAPTSAGKAPSRTPTPPPTAKATQRYRAHKLAGPLTVDGLLNDQAWAGIPTTRPFVRPNGGGLPANQATRAKIAWDDTHLYVGFTCTDDDIYNDQVGRDATLWKQDAVEIYLDPGADQKNYLEIQVSPTGEIFDALFTSRRTPEWPVAARALTLSGMVAKIDAKGSVNTRGDDVRDTAWTAEIAIPWADIPGVDGPPANQEWLVNLYRIDVASPARGGFMSNWTAVGGDFHNIAEFGRVRFDPASRGAAPPRRPPAPTPAAAPAPPTGAEGVKAPAAPAAAAPAPAKAPAAAAPAPAKAPAAAAPAPAKAPAAAAPAPAKAPAAAAPAPAKAPAAAAPAPAKAPAAPPGKAPAAPAPAAPTGGTTP